MCGKYSVSTWVAILSAALFAVFVVVQPGHAYRVCTFKGTVVDQGWRSMTVKSNGQCSEVNVGWRTKYIPNRRPCLGERVAVDFTLEDGYMKATKVVSLSPLPPSVRCYPPPPPSSAVCRTVGGEATGPAGPEACAPPRGVCTTRPPAHVTDPMWSPRRSGVSPERPKPGVKKPTKPQKKVAEAPTETTKPGPAETTTPPEKGPKTLIGEVVASSPKSLSLRVTEGESAELVNVRVGLKTKFIPFRRPAVGEKVQVDYQQENGDKFGYTVRVVQ